jgi:hypothetical protein
MKFKLSDFPFALILLVTACSKGYQDWAGRCSSELVGNYTDVIYTYNMSDQLSKAQQFRDKYDGVKCTAEQIRPGDIDWSDLQIDVNSEMNPMISRLQKGERTLYPRKQIRAYLPYSERSRS